MSAIDVLSSFAIVVAHVEVPAVLLVMTDGTPSCYHAFTLNVAAILCNRVLPGGELCPHLIDGEHE